MLLVPHRANRTTESAQFMNVLTQAAKDRTHRLRRALNQHYFLTAKLTHGKTTKRQDSKVRLVLSDYNARYFWRLKQDSSPY